MGKRYFFNSEVENDYHLDSFLVLKDNESFSRLDGVSVIVFNDSAKSDEDVEKIEETNNIQIAFNSVLDGNADEISLERLVRFYLNNS